MFSGIVEESAIVQQFAQTTEPFRLTIASKLDHSDTEIGDSICIDGVCLTVVQLGDGNLSFDLARETVRRSTLGNLKVGDRVNLERSLRLGGRLHGHFVSGHVDGVIILESRENDGNCDRLAWTFPAELAPYFAPKGSVSISGISLTVGEVSGLTFSVYIVPHTADVTTLKTLKPGDQANVEVDMLARYLYQMISDRKEPDNKFKQTGSSR